MKETVRAAILEAAEAVFAESGIHGARMEEIAERAGVSVGTLYNYFDDRQSLLSALLATQRQEVMAKLDRFLDRSTEEPFRTRLEEFYRLMLEHFEDHLRFFAVLLEDEIQSGRPKPTSSSRTTMRELAARAERLVKAGVAEGALRADDAGLYPVLLLGTMRGVFFQHLHQLQEKSAAPRLSELAGRLARFFLEGAEGKGRR